MCNSFASSADILAKE
jgi:hypothetical protein